MTAAGTRLEDAVRWARALQRMRVALAALHADMLEHEAECHQELRTAAGGPRGRARQSRRGSPEGVHGGLPSSGANRYPLVGTITSGTGIGIARAQAWRSGSSRGGYSLSARRTAPPSPA